MRSLRERNERTAAAASEAWANLKQAKDQYGDELTTAQTRALETLQAEYDRSAAAARSSDAEYKTSLANFDGSAAGSAQAVQRIGNLRSYARGEDLRGQMRADGPTIAEVVRSMVSGRPVEGYAMLTSGAPGAVPDYETLGLIEQALQQSVIFGAGARVVPMSAPSVKVGRITATPEVEIKPEAADRDLTDQAFTIVPEEMDAHSAFLYIEPTLEAAEDVANLEELILRVFSAQLARAIDKYALGGTGTAEPLGIGCMDAGDGVSVVDASGAALAGYGKFIEAIGKVRAKYHQPTSVVVDVPTWTTLAGLTATDDQPLMAPKAYTDLSEYVSNHLPLAAGPPETSVATVGDFSRLLVGIRTNLQVEVDRMGAGFKKGRIAIRGRMRWGSFCDDPTAFAVITGITNS
jgi:HK97 family phage major capsid protein